MVACFSSYLIFFMIVHENIREISWKSNDIGAVGAKRYFGI